MHAIRPTSDAPSLGASSATTAGSIPEQTSPAAPQQVSNGDRSSLMPTESLESFFSEKSTQLRELGMQRANVIQTLADYKNREEVVRLNPDTTTQWERDRVKEEREVRPTLVANLQSLNAELEKLNPSNGEISERFGQRFGFQS